MKRSFTILTAAFMLLAFLAIPMGMRGQTSVTWPGTTALPGTATAVANDQNITIMVSSTNTYTNPIRIYANTTVTIDALNDAKILSVAYEASSTGNYVTNAQNATVTPDVTPTVNGKIVTWTYAESANVTEFTFTPTAQTRSNGITITYITTGATPTCATPTFTPAAGTYTQAQNVSISCATEGATIYYTTNGDDPTTNSTVYTEAINVSSAMTIKAMAAKSGYDNSAIATAEYAFITLEHAGTLEDPYTVADAHTAIDANAGTQGVYATGIVSAIPTEWSTQYNNITFNFVDNEGDTDFLQAYRCVSGTGVDASTVAVGDVVVVHGNLTFHAASSTYEFGQGCQLVSLTHPVITDPTITVTPATINTPAEGADGTLAITYENIEDLISFDIQFCDANGNELEGDDPDWIYAEITEPTGDEGYTVSYIIDANDGEARNAYFKVYTFVGEELEEVYSNLVTINQEEYVAPTYAELPFEFNAGKDAIENTDGLYQDGLGTDYNASTNPNTQLKFDGTGDWLLLQFSERPGTLTFDIKGNSFSGGTFTVQTSENGTTFTDLKTYTSFGSSVESEEFTDLGENVRYIKWIYTTKDQGNVGLGNITLAAYEAPAPSITVDPSSYSVDEEAIEIGFGLVIENIEGEFAADLVYFEADGVTETEYDWFYLNTSGTNGFSSDYSELYVFVENNDFSATRTGYFKIYVLTDDGEYYSNLVTITQTAAPQEYDLTVEPFENLEIITFVNDEMEMEEDGTISVTAGAQVMLSIVADEGYVMETLMVNGVNHVNDIAGDFTYTFEMPAEDVTISATATEQVVPAGGDYVRITSLDQLTDGSVVVIAARYDEEHTNGYYAMSNATSGKPTGVLFTSTTSGDNEILPASIVDNEDDYYWVVNETDNGYTFTNAEGFLIGYTSSTNFATGGDNTEWTIASYTASSTSMVPNYAGFKIVNFNQSGRAFALNESHNYGPYSTSNMNGNDAYKYNFSLDFFVQTEVETETHTLTVEGYGNSTGGYHLIASPVSVDPSTVGMTEDNYDLYYFDQAEEDEWRNYKAGAFNLEPGKGYLYAHKDGGDFTLTGTPYSGNGVFPLSYSEGENLTMKGWNLVGNPFAEKATIGDRPFYTMNDTGSEIVSATVGDEINAMEGIFVKASATGETVTFSTAPETKSATLALNLSQGRGVIDRAIVRFDEGLTLPKFQINRNSTKLYILQDNEEFAVVNSTAQGEMPVSFKAAENGRYTLSINNESVEMNYLHLIDNMTGTDIDLLQTPSYSFDANTTDYAQRFKLVFATGNADDYFAFFSNGNLVINNEGQATLQVVDITGRMISNTTISGCESIDLHNMNAGVYMIRLINGNDVKVQKVVVR